MDRGKITNEEQEQGQKEIEMAGAKGEGREQELAF
jgi:hypothetical protein